jgi:hypothetical protein
MMVSIIAFKKPCSGAKTLGLGHSKDFENDFENLGVVFYSTEMFSEMVLCCWRWRWRKRSWRL